MNPSIMDIVNRSFYASSFEMYRPVVVINNIRRNIFHATFAAARARNNNMYYNL